MADGCDCPSFWGTWCPPFRHGEVAVWAFVTHGADPAPPGLAAILPTISQRAGQHWGFGIYPLQMAVTNRLARDLGNILLPHKFLADVCNEQRRTTERFAATEDGAPVLDLTVRSDGRARQIDPRMRIFTDIQGVLCSPANPANGVVRIRFGAAAATLTLGAHPATEHLRSLGLSPAGFAAIFSTDYKSFTGDFDALGPATRQVPEYIGSNAPQASLVVSPAPGIEYRAEQFPCQMPFGYTPDLALGHDFMARGEAALAAAASA